MRELSVSMLLRSAIDEITRRMDEDTDSEVSYLELLFLRESLETVLETWGNGGYNRIAEESVQQTPQKPA